MMRIAFDATSALGQGAGIGRFTLGELRGLSAADSTNHYYVTYPRNLRTAAKPTLGNNFTWQGVPLSEKESIWLWHRLRLPLPAETFLPAIDIFHAPDYTLPPLRRAKGIVTIHDLSFEALDDVHHPALRSYLRRAVPHSVQRADHIFADSQSTKEELTRFYDTNPDKITVVYPGVEPKFRYYDPALPADAERLTEIQEKYQLHRPYIFMVATLEPRKNISTLIRAFRHYREQGDPEMELLIAGGGGWLSEKEKLATLVPELKLEGHVRFLGFVPDEDLPLLLNQAQLLAYPSLYEGFGFPVLEALACGTPAVTARNTSLPEAGGDAALYIDDARDESALAHAMYRAAHDDAYRVDAIPKGLAHARRFTWEQTGKQVVDLYQKVLGT